VNTGVCIAMRILKTLDLERKTRPIGQGMGGRDGRKRAQEMKKGKGNTWRFGLGGGKKLDF